MDTIDTWIEQRDWQPLEVDCATAVMLKILDGKCRMGEVEKHVMARLYDGFSGHEGRVHAGKLLGDEAHALIAEARVYVSGNDMDEAMRMRVYEMRLLAETMISRPVMKAFKARIRAEGLFALT